MHGRTDGAEFIGSIHTSVGNQKKSENGAPQAHYTNWHATGWTETEKNIPPFMGNPPLYRIFLPPPLVRFKKTNSKIYKRGEFHYNADTYSATFGQILVKSNDAFKKLWTKKSDFGPFFEVNPPHMKLQDISRTLFPFFRGSGRSVMVSLLALFSHHHQPCARPPYTLPWPPLPHPLRTVNGKHILFILYSQEIESATVLTPALADNIKNGLFHWPVMASNGHRKIAFSIDFVIF